MHWLPRRRVIPGGKSARALEVLVDGCESLDGARTALSSFLNHRSDWWAFIEDQADAYAHAQHSITAQLGIGPDDDPLQGFPDKSLRMQLQAFAQLLGKNTTKTNSEHAARLDKALNEPLAATDILARVSAVIFTGKGTPRVYKAGNAMRKRLGEQGEQQFLDLHASLVSELGAVQDRCARYRTLQTNLAWYTAGMQLLKHYQRIKKEQRLLDFSDLEWKACQLLNRSDHASWVQYKLDTRIDHLLVDEFQDTNPTQWRLLLPLLEELAAGNAERKRSVFLVGDRKQSIYGFRRANPALLDEASAWLEERLQAKKYPLDASRRSAQAIIDCVNTVFAAEPLKQRITAFNPHSTHHPALYGRVEILPLVSAAAPETALPVHGELRNPLETPRRVDADPPHAREGRLIAVQIAALVGAGTQVVRNEASCALDYGDIIILLRQRTHASSYERALREAGIPYTSASRGELLDNLEVRDLEALLKLLISPYANLELAQVLRSPLFGLGSEQLLPLARREQQTWYERLGELAGEAEEGVYAKVYAVLEGWRALTGKIPVHDLLDRIYHEADIMQRYQAAFPVELRARVQASLTRFIELALELDNGRYPSLPHFLDQLTRLRQSARDQPDEGTPDDSAGKRVRLLTIHGAKGLEAPVIFLADSAVSKRNRSANETLVIWPPGKTAPQQFLLTGKKALQDTVSRALLEKQQQDALNEDANLLYVAMTRARQYLFVSGSEGKQSGDATWYSMIRAAVSAWQTNSAGHLVHESGRQSAVQPGADAPGPVAATDPRLSRKIASLQAQLVQIAPSRSHTTGSWQPGDADGRERGLAIHAMLDWLSAADASLDVLPPQLAHQLGRAADNPDLQAWWQEALHTVRNPKLSRLFDNCHYQRAMNEVPVQFMDEGRLIYGIIDRVVIQEEAVLVIDYKTHRADHDDQLSALADDYREQMRLYARAAALLWPEHAIRACLLFTHRGTLVPVDDENYHASPW